MIKVSIYSEAVRNQSGIARATQKPYNMDFQEAWFYTVGRDGKPVPHPQKVELILDHNDEGAALFYAVGDYQLAPNSVYIDKNGKPAFSPRLVALKKAAPPVAAA